MGFGADSTADMQGTNKKKMTSLLLLLSLRNDDLQNKMKKKSTGVYECKTCSRCFPTFQALGGHRTSHKRPRVDRTEQKKKLKPRVHVCSICGAVFPMGQALGGHMRRHQPHETAQGEKKELMPDLNLPPAAAESGVEFWDMGFRFGLSHEALPVIDFFGCTESS